MIRFRIGRCLVKVRALFFAVLGFLLFSSMGESAIFGLLAAVLHELGHLSVMALLGVIPQEVRLNPFGIDIVEAQGSARSYGKDALIALAGPVVNLLAWLAGWGLGVWCGVDTREWMLANLAIGLMNLLPVESLDGGQALYAALCLRWRAERAASVVLGISFLTLLPLGTAGFFLLLQSRYNFSLLLISLYLIFLLIWKRGRYFTGEEAFAFCRKTRYNGDTTPNGQNRERKSTWRSSKKSKRCCPRCKSRGDTSAES